MIQSYCDISATPAFQFLVTDLTPVLGDKANEEAFRDYYEQNGKLRTAEEILDKMRGDYFSTVPAKVPQVVNTEIEMTQAAKFKELGRSVPKKTLSNTEIIKLRQLISKVNNELVKKGINRVYRLASEDVKQVGQSDNYTWNVRVFPGNLDVEVKAARLSAQDLLTNRVPRLITNGTRELQTRLFDQEVAYGELRGFTSGNQIKKVNYEADDKSILRDGSRTVGSILEQIQSNPRVLWLDGNNGISFSKYMQKFTGESDFWANQLNFLGRENLSYNSFNKGRTLKEQFDSKNDSPALALAVVARLLQKDDSFVGRVYSNLRTKTGLELPVGLENEENSISTFYYDGNQIIINLHHLDKLASRYDNYEAFVNAIDLILTEEVLHSTIDTVATTKELDQVYDELTPEEIAEIKKTYNFKIPTKNAIVQEYLRALLQAKFFGTTSDVETKPTVVRIIKKAMDYLISVFKNNPNRVSNLIIERVSNFVKSTGAITPQDDLTGFDTISKYSQQIIRKMADAMGQQVGVDYSFVSATEAAELTKNATNPWKGQTSFFFNGQVYFIEGSLTPSDVLHEFVHPIIKNIAGTNKKLFDNLYSRAQLTDEGKRIIENVADLYPNLDRNSDDFKEEVLVRSIEEIRNLNNRGLESTSAFQKFVDGLLYSIKQFLRGVFGQKIQVHTLSPATTLQDLSDILEQGGKFELDPTIITDEDLVAYKNEYNKSLKDFVVENADAKEVKELTDNFFNAMKKQLRNLMSRNDLGELANLMQNKYGTGELQKINKNLKSYQDDIQSNAKKLEDDLELTHQRVTAIVNSLNNVDNLVKQLHATLLDLVKDVDNRDNVQKVMYIKKVLNYWGDFVTEAKVTLNSNGVSSLKMVDNAVGNIASANAIVDKFYLKVGKEFIYDQVKNTADNLDRLWEERKKVHIAKNVAPAIIAKETADYNSAKMTPEKVDAALKGKLTDISWLNANMESFGANTDPVVGGIALFLKNNEAETAAKIQQNTNEFIMELKPLLDKVGYNPNKPGQIGEDLGQVEKIGHMNEETKEFEEVSIWRFKNQFTGADIIRDNYRFKIKQAGLKYDETGSEEDRQKLADIQAEWEDHNRKFFNDKYTKEFYDAYKLLTSDEIGREAKAITDNLYDDLTRLNADLERATSDDIVEIADLVDNKRREIQQVSSLTDLFGNPKTGRDLEIAERLQAFKEATKDIYESEEIPGAFQLAYQTFEEQLLSEGKKPGSPEYEGALDRWKSKNLREVIKDEFWDKMDELSKAYQEIISKLPTQEQLQLNIEEGYAVMKEMIKGNRDESGQPLGAELSEERQAKVKAAQESIDRAREALRQLSGLSPEEDAEMQAILARLTDTGKMTPKDNLRYMELIDKQSKLGLNRVERSRLRGILNEMDELRTKEPTDSYVDTVNNFLAGMETESVGEALGYLSFDKNTIGRLSNTTLVEKLFLLSPEFETWFKRNHVSKDIVNYETDETGERWERTYAWNVTKPRDEKYYEKTTFKNLANEEVTIQGLPSLRYFKRIVKDEYITPIIVGVTQDNKGNWLPKTLAQGAADDRYINKEYERLKSSNSDLFKLLEKTKELYLKFQEGAERPAKLGLDFPRERKGLIERSQAENPLKRLLGGAKEFFTSMRDGWENGYNWDETQQLVQMDLFTDERSGIPVSSISNLDIKEVSTEVFFTMMKYMSSLETNKNLTKTSPMTRMIQDIVNNEKNQPLYEQITKNSTIVHTGRKKDNYIRRNAVNNLMERTYEGRMSKGVGADSQLAQTVSKVMFKTAASSYLTLNLPSDIKNAVGMKFQSMIEAVGGKHFSTRDLLSSEADASNASMAIVMETYKQGPKSLDVQLVEIMDPERDRFSKTVGQSLSRTPFKDSLLILERLGDFRRITQLQAGLQTLFAMMKHDKVTQNGKEISYRDAWQVKDGKLQLKEGIDPSEGITYDQDGNIQVGEKFKQKRAKYQTVLDNLNGAMGRADSPEIDRFLFVRFITFFRRFLTNMITNRWAFSGNLLKGTGRGRVDYRLNETKEGFYITFLGLLRNIARGGVKYLPAATADEKTAFLKITSEVGFVMIMRYLVLPLLFDWDPDDEDRFKKLKAKSDSLPLPFVYNDPNREFSLPGWLSNHAMLSIMQVNGEADAFIPWPGLGLSDYKNYMDIKSLAAGPTLATLFNITQDLSYMVSGNDKAYYERAVGAYEFDQEGNAKLYHHLAKAVGLSSSTADPALALRNFTSFENR